MELVNEKTTPCHEDRGLRWGVPEERRHRPLRIAVVVPVVVQLDLAVVAIEVQVRHVRPRIVVGNRKMCFLLP